VDTEGPQTEHIQGEAPNVVRLPVDWLGPRDELVPIGPPRDEDASSRGDQTAEGPDRRQLRALTEQPTMPPSAADFWGERAEAVQDVLQGPAPAPPAPSDVEARPSARDDMEARPSARDDMEARPRARDNVEPPPPTEPTEPPSLTLPSRGTKRARAMAQRAADWQRRALSSAQWGRLTAAAGVIAIAGVAALIGANVLTSSPGGSAISRKTASTCPGRASCIRSSPPHPQSHRCWRTPSIEPRHAGTRTPPTDRSTPAAPRQGTPDQAEARRLSGTHRHMRARDPEGRRARQGRPRVVRPGRRPPASALDPPAARPAHRAHRRPGRRRAQEPPRHAKATAALAEAPVALVLRRTRADWIPEWVSPERHT
jgi:hypothetical protein